MAIFLKRDTKVYLRKTVGSTSVIWEVPVLDGFSFSQGNTTSEVTLNEMQSSTGYSKRGRRAFNDALAPAEWSLSTYIRPFTSATNYSTNAETSTGGAGGSSRIHAIEEQLWANFVGKGGWTTSATGIATVDSIAIATGVTGVYEVDQGEYTTDASGFGATFIVDVTGVSAATVTIVNPGTGYAIDETITIPGYVLGGSGDLTFDVATVSSTETEAYDAESENFTRDTTDLNISFAGSAVGELGTFDLFFVMGATSATTLQYAASATLEIYKLSNCVVNEATVNFEVDGIAMIEWSGNASTLTTEGNFDARLAIREGITATDNFIRNKLTALELVANPGATRTEFDGAGNGVYNITITGGSVTFSNNVTYLTPETLGIVNIPIGHITGNKSVSGNFTAYVDSGVAGDSGSLFDAATSADARSIVTNSFALTFKVGGTTGTPRFEISLPTAHLEIPTIQTDDVIAIDVAFQGLPSSITSNDEAALTYVAP